jgi:hypothetical protein
MRTQTIAALVLSLSAGTVLAVTSNTDRSNANYLRNCTPPSTQTDSPRHCGFPHQQAKNVEVLFVLDTTGSMSGLIDGAKQKIWSIATKIAQAQPAPELRMGLIGYRDRGDDYVTTRTDLTDDLDAVYEKLMAFRARGGGDTPESVNEALFEAIERTDWSSDDDTLRLVFLVGDAPPKMNYDDDIKYTATCKIAREKNIRINTILAGRAQDTAQHWNTIADLAHGRYAQIEHDSGVQHAATPYDDDIAKLDREYASLMIDYGDRATKLRQAERRDRGSKIASASSPEAAADRALYNQTAAGGSNVYGEQELVSDLLGGRIAYDEVKAEELPEALQSKSEDELRALIEKNAARRAEIKAQLADLAAKRAAHQAQALKDAPSDSFDTQVLITLSQQGATIGLTFDTPAPKSTDKPTSDD